MREAPEGLAEEAVPQDARAYEFDGETVVISKSALRCPQELVRFAVVDTGQIAQCQASTFERADFERRAVPLTDPQAIEQAMAGFRTWLALDAARRRAELQRQAEEQREAQSEIDQLSRHRRAVASAGVAGSGRPSMKARVTDPLHDLVALVLAPGDPERGYRTAPDFSDRDLDLALAWLERSRPVDESRRVGVSKREGLASWAATNGFEYDLARMLSARAAERVVCDVLRDAGLEVADVSVQQLDESTDDGWKRCDLRVTSGGSTELPLEYDVKNARRPWQNVGTYTRFCVPRFKSDRCGSNVRIVGTLSPYLFLRQALDVEGGRRMDRHVFVLGETDASRLAALESRYGEHETLRVRAPVGRMGTPGFVLPPWAFESLGPFARSAEIAASELADLLKSDADAVQRLPSPARLVLAGALGLPPEQTGAPIPADQWRREFSIALAALHATRRPGLPDLFLTLLHHFIRMLHRNEAEVQGYRPRDYQPFLWRAVDAVPAPSHPWAAGWNVDDRDALAPRASRYPLGIHDPLGTIATLVGAVDVLWVKSRAQLRNYRNFTLHGWQVLRATHRRTNLQHTVLAYCGGRTSVGTCGMWPLLLGVHEHCPHNFLRCSRCGYCCETCHPSRRGPRAERPVRAGAVFSAGTTA